MSSQVEKAEKKDFLDVLAQNVMLAALVIAAACTLLSFIFQFISQETQTLFAQLSFYAYGWMVFVSLGPSMKRGAFMKIDLIVSKYPEGVRKTLAVVCDAIMFVLIVYLFVFSVLNLGKVLSEHTMNAKAPVIPLALAYLASVAGCGLGVIAGIVRSFTAKGGEGK